VKKFRRTLQDVRVKRGADVASDHHLVTGKMKLKLRKDDTGDTERRQKFNVGFLREGQKREEFGVALRNRFQVLQELVEEERTVDNTWKNIKDAFLTTCQESLGQTQQ
jgi:hypothetical protein